MIINVDNIVISKFGQTKTNSKSLYKDIRPLVFIMTFNVEDKNNKLMSFRRDENFLEKYKAIWTKIEDLKILT